MKSKQRGLNLMRVQVHLRIDQRGRQEVGRIGAHAPGQLPSDVLGLVGCQARQNGFEIAGDFALFVDCAGGLARRRGPRKGCKAPSRKVGKFSVQTRVAIKDSLRAESTRRTNGSGHLKPSAGEWTREAKFRGGGTNSCIMKFFSRREASVARKRKMNVFPH